MTLSSPRAKLHESLKVLTVRWDDTREGWNDQVGRQFEADWFEPIPPTVQSALLGIDRLAAILTQMRSECE